MGQGLLQDKDTCPYGPMSLALWTPILGTHDSEVPSSMAGVHLPKGVWCFWYDLPRLRGGVHWAWVCELGNLPTLCSDEGSQEWGQEGLARGWDLNVFSFFHTLGAGLHAD